MSDTDTNEHVANLPAVREEDRPQRMPIMAGGQPRAIVPQDFDGAWRVATMAVRGGLNVRGLETVEKCMVAILHGMEVGLTPMAALQSIAVINGRPTIYGDGAMGLVLASPVCDWVRETSTGTFPNDDYTAICEVKRKNSPVIIKGEFSVADAKQAGLWDTREMVTKKGRSGDYTGKNDSPWYKYPKRMLKFRARWALRDGFADVLKGLHLREEIEDMEPTAAEAPEQPKRRAPAPPSETSTAQETTAATTTEVIEEAEVTEVTETEAPKDDGFPGDKARRAPPPPADDDKVDEALWLESLQNAYVACEDTITLGEAQGKYMMPMKGKVSPEAWKAAVVKTNDHLKRIQK